VGVEFDPDAVVVAQRNLELARVDVRILNADVGTFRERVDTVVMNPPFGAQRRGADRPFWETALLVARKAVYAFSLRDSRTFIERQAVARGATIEAALPVNWNLPRTFSHHREKAVTLPVDLWVLRQGTDA
jgi:putative methylase